MSHSCHFCHRSLNRTVRLFIYLSFLAARRLNSRHEWPLRREMFRDSMSARPCPRIARPYDKNDKNYPVALPVKSLGQVAIAWARDAGANRKNENPSTFLLHSSGLAVIQRRMKSPQDIEEQLREAIIHSSMTRYRLSVLSGVSQTILSMFVHRKRCMTLDTAAKLAKVLKLELRPVQDAGKGR